MFDLPDNEILPLSKEHVFWTWSAQAKVNPIAVKRAKGVYFWDVDPSLPWCNSNLSGFNPAGVTSPSLFNWRTPKSA